MTVLEQLEQGKQRADRANVRRNQIQAKLEATRQLFAEAQREAETLVAERREKGVHVDLLEVEREVGLDLLRELLTREESENAAATASYLHAVDQYERHIATIEEALANPEAMAALIATLPPLDEPAAPAVAPVSKPGTPVFSEDDI